MGTTTGIDRKFAGRSTQQRQLILEIIEQADTHVDADEIYRQARQKSPNISLSTAYHSLQFLKDLGLVEEQARILESELDGIRKRLEELKK